MTAATSQPSPPITLTATYSGKVDGGWVAYDYVGNQIGAATLTPTSQFSVIKSSGTLADGSTTLSANAATDTGGTASMSISTAVVKNAFTMVGVFRVRGTSGVGVGARSNTDNIFLWRNSGNYNVRVNNVTLTGAAMPLNTTLNYVLTSNSSGIYLYVNGTLILSGAASASSANTGVPLELYEDSRGGGAMDLDVAMVALLNYGASTTEAQSLSNNPWQMFESSSGSGVTGTLATTENVDTSAASGSPIVAGSGSSSEATDAVTASGSVSISGTLSRTEAFDALAASGTATAGSVTGSLAITEQGDTLAANGSSAAPTPAGDGGGAGPVREVRAFADMLDKAHKLTRSQKKKRRAELVEEVRELLPALPEAEQIAPAIAQIVFEQESKARAMCADRPIEALAPVVVPFDAKAAIAELIERFMADEAMRRQIEAERAEEDEIDAFLLLGS